MHDINQAFLLAEWLGTAAFAVSGAMIAIDSHTDLFGVIFLAGVTALGGGTLRDILIGHLPPRMFTSFSYLLLSAVCALIVFMVARRYKERYVKRERLIEAVTNIFDAIGLGVFAVSGARIGMEAGFHDNVFMVVFLAMTSSVGGGMLRDVLLQKIPFVLTKRIYAVAAIAGALVYALGVRVGISAGVAYTAGAITTLLLRLLATAFKWNLPKALD